MQFTGVSHNFFAVNIERISSILLVRSSRPEVFCKKGVLGNFTRFTGKDLHPKLCCFCCRALIFFENVPKVFTFDLENVVVGYDCVFGAATVDVGLNLLLVREILALG